LKNELRVQPLFSAALLSILFSLPIPQAHAQSEDPLAQRIAKVVSRPEFAHANFGIEFYSLDTGKVLYALNADKLFVPASTTKILTEGTLLAKLGADYRFHTRIYRTGPVNSKGKLKGDLILVASGDPNLSNRIQSDGTLAFVDQDHSYQGPALPGDPLVVIKQLAKDVAAKGIHKIEGRVLIDATLFPDGPREGGTEVVMSSIMINDNVIDLLAKSGAKVGDPIVLDSSPQTSYIRIVNRVLTSPADSKPSLESPIFSANPDGSVVVTLSGNLPLGIATQPASIAVPSPTKFAETVFREALVAAGVQIRPASGSASADFSAYARSYTSENQIAEHVSPPLSEEIKITLKVSQNLHAGMGPYLLGTLIAKDTKAPLDAGFKVEGEFLQSARLDLSGASQGDGAGGDWADLFSPDFMVHYLTYWTTRPDYEVFFKALPILGKDGTLAKIQPKVPVFAWTCPATGRIWLNFREGTVFAENRKRFEKDFVVRTGGPVGEVVHHKVWAEEIGPVASGTVALRGAGKIKPRGLQKFAFDFEPRVERCFCVFRDERSEEIRPHAGVEILADLQGDFDFFRERRRNMFRDLILRGVGARVSGKNQRTRNRRRA